MPNKNKTAIAYVLDCSHSMGVVIPAVVSGFNEFITGQKKEPGEALMSLVTFASDVREDYMNVPLSEVKELTFEDYTLRGSTALYDAVGQTINSLGARLRELPEHERPGQVVVVIHTDGEENSSCAFKPEEVQRMIKHQQDKYNWKFIFLGAGQDAWDTSNFLGIRSSYSFANNAQGYTHVSRSLSQDVANYRSTGDLLDKTVDLRKIK